MARIYDKFPILNGKDPDERSRRYLTPTRIVWSTLDEGAEITGMEDEIKQVMGEEETLLAGAFKVTWTPYTSTRFDSARFKKDHAELAEAYTKTTITRRFSVR